MRIALLVVDSLRADAPSFAQGPCQTPTLDRLAARGALFPRAQACAPWTVPSVAAMLTGVYAHRLGLYRWEQPWSSQFPNVFQVFQSAGYQVASLVFDPDYLFRAVPEARVVGSSMDPHPGLRWLAECQSPNLFCFFHYWGTHIPYLDRAMSIPAWKRLTDALLEATNFRPSIGREKLKGLYQRSVERMSEHFLPAFLQALAAHADHSGWCLVLVGDHGESWGERFGPDDPLRDVFDLHGRLLTPEVLQVPLLFYAEPGFPPGTREGLARTVDLAATLPALAGLPSISSYLPEDKTESESTTTTDGLSLLPSLQECRPAPGQNAMAACSAEFLDGNEDPSGVEDLWLELSLHTAQASFHLEPATGERRWYDLTHDPLEKKELPPATAPAWAWEKLKAELSRASVAPCPSAEAQQALKALGYLG